MKRPLRLLAFALLAAATLAFPLAAGADHATRPHTQNMHALGHSPDFGSFLRDDFRDDQRRSQALGRAAGAAASAFLQCRSIRLAADAQRRQDPPL